MKLPICAPLLFAEKFGLHASILSYLPILNNSSDWSKLHDSVFYFSTAKHWLKTQRSVPQTIYRFIIYHQMATDYTLKQTLCLMLVCL